MPKKDCPLALTRWALDLTRTQLATLSGCNYSTIGNCEKGLATAIPASIITALSPHLAGIGTTPERLQSDYRLWKISLKEDLRRELEGGAR